MGFTTSKTLLERINGNDEVSWQEFYEQYIPLIRLRGRDFHLNQEERDELVQNVMLEIFKVHNTFHYDPAKGKFRNYLKTITTHCAIRLRNQRPPENFSLDAGITEPESLMELENSFFDQRWQEEWESHLLDEGLRLLRERMEPLSYQAFYLYAIKQVPPGDVAEKLGLSVNTVYIAKSRALAFLRDQLKMVED